MWYFINVTELLMIFNIWSVNPKTLAKVANVIALCFVVFREFSTKLCFNHFVSPKTSAMMSLSIYEAVIATKVSDDKYLNLLRHQTQLWIRVPTDKPWKISMIFQWCFKTKIPYFHDNSECHKTEKHRTTCHAWSPHTSYDHHCVFVLENMLSLLTWFDD